MSGKKTVGKEAVSYTHLDVYKRQVHTLASAGLVALYEYEGKPYLYIPTWTKHQNVRAKRSKYPEPPVDNSVEKSVDSICAVSYTHLDVYKRQV